MEPREAANVLIPIDGAEFAPSEVSILREAVTDMRGWRDYA